MLPFKHDLIKNKLPQCEFLRMQSLPHTLLFVAYTFLSVLAFSIKFKRMNSVRGLILYSIILYCSYSSKIALKRMFSLIIYTNDTLHININIGHPANNAACRVNIVLYI